jgi:hypothetical protein
MAQEHIASTLASHPQFIGLAYQLVENAIKHSKIPHHTCGVIGGAAGILHRYHHMEDHTKTVASLNRNTRTTDIDIALWYHGVVGKADFLKHNQNIKKNIEKKFSGPFLQEWKEIIEQILGRALQFELEIRCDMKDMKSYDEMTGIINIRFMVDRNEINLIEIIIHNMFYSQYTNPDFKERTGPTNATTDVTYLDTKSTEVIKVTLFVDEAEDKTYYVDVRVPTIDRLLLQLYFVYGNKLIQAKITHDSMDYKYFGRMEYLLQYASDECLSTLIRMEHALIAEIQHRIDTIGKRNKSFAIPRVRHLESIIPYQRRAQFKALLHDPSEPTLNLLQRIPITSGLPPIHPPYHPKPSSHSSIRRSRKNTLPSSENASKQKYHNLGGTRKR